MRLFNVITLAVLASVSLVSLAKLPDDVTQLSPKEIFEAVNKLEINKEDCNRAQLNTMNLHVMQLLLDKKISSEEFKPVGDKIATQILNCKKARLYR